MKQILKSILIKISKVILLLNRVKTFIIPTQLQEKSKLESKLENNLVEETFSNFKEHFKKSVLLDDILQIREYAIKTSLLKTSYSEFLILVSKPNISVLCPITLSSFK